MAAQTMHSRLKRDMLVVLYDLGDATGAEIRRKLADERRVEVSDGTFYPHLKDMVDCELVRKEDRPDRRSNTYTITRRGEREVEDHAAWVCGVVEE